MVRSRHGGQQQKMNMSILLEAILRNHKYSYPTYTKKRSKKKSQRKGGFGKSKYAKRI